MCKSASEIDDEDRHSPTRPLDDSSNVWMVLSDDINTLEKIREREQAALKTARTARHPMASTVDTSELVPVRTSRTGSFHESAILQRITMNSLITHDVASRVDRALKVIHRGRQMAAVDEVQGAILEGRGMDAFVDALAHA